MAADRNSSGIIIVGIGNEFRSDDTVGLVVVRRLRELLSDSVIVYEHSREGTSLIDLWESDDTVFLVDAVCSDAPCGAIIRKDLLNDTVAEVAFRHSTHSISLVDAIEFARIMHRLPMQLIFYGIEGKNFGAGERYSSEIENTIPSVVETIQKEISDLLHTSLDKQYA